MNVPIPESAGGLATFVASAVGIAYSLSKVVTSWRGDSATGSSYKAMQATVEGLASEIERLAKQNKALADKTNQYQLQIIRLNDEIISLRNSIASRCAKCGAATLADFKEAEARLAEGLALSEERHDHEDAEERKLRIVVSAEVSKAENAAEGQSETLKTVRDIFGHEE
jgi:hypothetical protein